MAAEQYANTAKTTLNGAINAAVTSVVVSSAAAFPATGPFRILVGTELMLVTAVAVNTFTVTRGAESTTAASHANGDDVTCVLTDEALRRVGTRLHLSDVHANRPAAAFANEGDLYLPTDGFTIARSDGSAWLPYGPLFPVTAPPTTGWAAVNQGGATITTTRDAITIKDPGRASGESLRIYKRTAPGTPYTATFGLQHNFMLNRGNLRLGVCFRTSGNSKLTTFAFLNNQIRVDRWTSETVFFSNVTSNFQYLGMPQWFRLEDDGTNIAFYLGSDPYNFVKLYSEVRSNFSTPDEVGIFTNANENTVQSFPYDLFATLFHFKTA
jgi:hypothetical protein